MTPTWPKKIVVCLECGIGRIGRDWPSFAPHCKGGGPHGPTQTIPVVPEAAAEDLATTMEDLTGSPCPSSAKDAKAALAGYEDALKGDPDA